MRPGERLRSLGPEGDGPQLRLDNPVQSILAGGRLPSRRRATLGGLTALAIALGGNLGGVTSRLLALDGGQLARRLRADVLYPVQGFKRCLDLQQGFEFSFPADWLADQTLVARAAQRAEQQRPLDLPSPSSPSRPRAGIVEPAVAFGPPGSSGEENISVVVAPIAPGFQLQSLGTPEQMAQRFLTTTVAPPGSGREASLLQADAVQDGEAGGQLYYILEFSVRSAAFQRHNLAVLTARRGSLYTLNVQCPEARWPQQRERLERAAATFRLVGADYGP